MPILIGELLADRKRVTRRLMKAADADYAQFIYDDGVDDVTYYLRRRSPYGAAGDRLWVREHLEQRDGLVAYVGDPSLFARIDGELVRWPWKRRMIPGRYCPRRFSRIDLEVVGVRAEHLQDITEEDAQLEGLPRNWSLSDDDCDGDEWNGEEHGWLTPAGLEVADVDDCDECWWRGRLVRAVEYQARAAFRAWWDHMHPGDLGWDMNPWVWRPEFRRVEVTHA